MNPALWLFAIVGGTFTLVCLIVGTFMDLEDRRLYRAAGYTMSSRARTRAIEAQANPPQPELVDGDGVPYWHALVISSLSLSVRDDFVHPENYMGELQGSPSYSKDARMSASSRRTELQGSVSSSRTGLQGPVPQ